MAGAGRTGGRGLIVRRVVGVVLAVLAGLAAPASVVSARAHALVSDTDSFVATYEPVVRSAAVQGLVTDGLTIAITARLGLGDNLIAQALVGRVVTEAAATDLFAEATTSALRLAHGELVALLSGEPGRLQVADGVVQLRFAPFVDALASRLDAAGVPFLDRLPEVTGGVPLFQVDPRLLPALQAGYRALGGATAWLPWLALAFAVAAAWLWPGARSGLIGLGVALAGGVALVWGVAAWAGQQLTATLADPLVPLATLVVGRSVEPVLSPLLAIGVTGLVLAGLAALSAPSGHDRAVRTDGAGA